MPGLRRLEAEVHDQVPHPALRSSGQGAFEHGPREVRGRGTIVAAAWAVAVAASAALKGRDAVAAALAVAAAASAECTNELMGSEGRRQDLRDCASAREGHVHDT